MNLLPPDLIPLVPYYLPDWALNISYPDLPQNFWLNNAIYQTGDRDGATILYNLESSIPLTPYQKYLRTLSFYDIVTQGSQEFISLERCFQMAYLKKNNELMEYFNQWLKKDLTKYWAPNNLELELEEIGNQRVELSEELTLRDFAALIKNKYILPRNYPQRQYYQLFKVIYDGDVPGLKNLIQKYQDLIFDQDEIIDWILKFITYTVLISGTVNTKIIATLYSELEYRDLFLFGLLDLPITSVQAIIKQINPEFFIQNFLTSAATWPPWFIWYNSNLIFKLQYTFFQINWKYSQVINFLSIEVIINYLQKGSPRDKMLATDLLKQITLYKNKK